MAPQLVSALPEGAEWLYKVKWDGYRAMVVKAGAEVRLLSRKENELGGDFAGVVAAATRDLTTSPVDSHAADILRLCERALAIAETQGFPRCAFTLRALTG